MAETDGPTGTPDGVAPGPDGQSEAERALRTRIDADEARLARDERRLTEDEYRLAEDERETDRNWRLILALGGLLALTILALVLSVVALNRDIEAVAKADPKDDSVGSAALRDGAVTPPKLAGGAVTPRALADGSVTPPALAAGAVTRSAIASGAVNGSKVQADGLTGSAIDESTLGPVPRASRADLASDAGALADVPAARYLSRVTVVTASTATSTTAPKGPLRAVCPDGTSVVGGGAAVDGSRAVAVTTSAPDGRSGWIAEAAVIGETGGPWQLVATAICARGG